MLYDLDFAFAGLMFLLILYFVLVRRYNQNMHTIMQLKRLLVLLILALTADIITAVTISYAEIVPLWLNYLLNIIFFELNAFCVAQFPKYIRAIMADKGEKNNIYDRVNDLLLWGYGIICATTPISHWIFYFDEELKYQHGLMYVLIFLLPLYFLVFSFINLINHKEIFNKRQFYSIIGFIVLAISGPALQMALPGNKIIDFFMLSLASFVVVMGLETPDFIKLENTLQELEEHKELLELAKQREEERNKVIHEMTRSASWSIKIDNEKNLTEAFWSDEFYWLLGYEKEEAEHKVDSLWSNSLHPDDFDYATEAFGKGMAGLENYDILCRLRSKNSDYKWYRCTGELKTLADGSGTVYQGIIQDINDEKIREDLARERIEALEELEKSQQALTEALRKAEAADKAKSDFLANMSHEIRTPINAVLGMNELIYRESTEPAIQRYSTNVEEAGQALLSLINDILDFSKIEAGRMELAPSDYELSALLREVNNMIGIRCVDKQLEFTIKNNPETPNFLYGDEVRIRQILLNILNNAVKYTDEGSVTLEVDYEKQDDDNILLVMSAIDSGIGIKDEDLPLLYESFKRIDLEHNRKREGTGLGLNITKSFLQMMGGSIEVKSEHGKGSTFIVRIPQQVKAKGTVGNLVDTSNTKKKSKYQASFMAPGARILVVDDVAINLEVIKGLLKQTQIIIDTATSGRECLSSIACTKYDIIFLDHMMPEMDGVETLQRMRADGSHANTKTPVIMLTANAIIGSKEEYLKAGFADYLSKPVRPEEIEMLLKKYLPQEKINR